MSKSIITSPTSPNPIGPYSHAVETNGLIFTSGQVAINSETGEMMQANITQETAQVMENLKKILTSAGVTFDHVVKTTIFLSDMALFAQVNEVYGSYFTKDFPARETVAVKTLPRNVNIEISITAVVNL